MRSPRPRGAEGPQRASRWRRLLRTGRRPPRPPCAGHVRSLGSGWRAATSTPPGGSVMIWRLPHRRRATQPGLGVGDHLLSGGQEVVVPGARGVVLGSEPFDPAYRHIRPKTSVSKGVADHGLSAPKGSGWAGFGVDGAYCAVLDDVRIARAGMLAANRAICVVNHRSRHFRAWQGGPECSGTDPRDAHGRASGPS